MKKLIAISVVFALVAGVAFAVDLGGTVIGHVNVIEKTGSGDVNGSAGFDRLRLEGAGEVADGKFGGWLRLQALGFGYTQHSVVGNYNFDEVRAVLAYGYAWWKPIDQLKLRIGGNGGDGFWGKEGITGWSFVGPVGDADIATNTGNIWGGGFAGDLKFRNAFFGGVGYNSLNIEITPVEMVSINIALPFFTHGKIGDIFMGTVAQVDLNLSFGNFAFTYAGASVIENSEAFGYFSLTAIDGLELDFGIGSAFKNTPLKFGLGVAYTSDSWGIKVRSLLAIPVNGDHPPFGMIFDALPYFVINENFRAYVNVGIGIEDFSDLTGGAGWHLNPYIEVGEYWGAKFAAGFKVSSKDMKGGSGAIEIALPIALIVSF